METHEMRAIALAHATQATIPLGSSVIEVAESYYKFLIGENSNVAEPEPEPKHTHKCAIIHVPIGDRYNYCKCACGAVHQGGKWVNP